MTDRSSPTLSICVPTYNRALLLKECLGSIQNAVERHTDEVELIISDNASQDDTTEIVTEFRKRHPWVQYYRNSENIGAERNFFAVAAKARGNYLWIFSDDDKMSIDGISAVMQQIKAGHEMIVCNYSVWSRDFAQMKKSRGLPVKQSAIYNNADQVMRAFGTHLGYITAIVTKRAMFFALPYDMAEPYIEYGLPHLYVLYCALLPQCKVAYLSDPVFFCRGDNSPMTVETWNKVFFTGTTLIFDALRTQGYSSSAIRAAKARVLKDYAIGVILVRKRDGESTKGLFKLMLGYYKGIWEFWVLCVPALVAPQFVAQLVSRIYQFARIRYSFPQK